MSYQFSGLTLIIDGIIFIFLGKLCRIFTFIHNSFSIHVQINMTQVIKDPPG